MESKQERFHNLLALAASSTYAGERAAAFQAAERLAKRHGLSMQEAARGGLAAQEPERAPQFSPGEWQRRAARDLSHFVHLLDTEIEAQKAARERARAEAVRRGLDAAEREAEDRSVRGGRWVQVKPRRMDSWRLARVLLAETTLPLQEVVDLSGLDVYQVVGLKLKMRSAA